MKVIADLCVVPMGVGVSVSRYVAACEKVFVDAGLKPRMHGYGMPASMSLEYWRNRPAAKYLKKLARWSSKR